MLAAWVAVSCLAACGEAPEWESPGPVTPGAVSPDARAPGRAAKSRPVDRAADDYARMVTPSDDPEPADEQLLPLVEPPPTAVAPRPRVSGVAPSVAVAPTRPEPGADRNSSSVRLTEPGGLNRVPLNRPPRRASPERRKAGPPVLPEGSGPPPKGGKGRRRPGSGGR